MAVRALDRRPLEMVQKLSKALRDAVASCDEAAKDRLATAPHLCLVFTDAETTWTLRWDANTREAELRTDVDDAGGIRVSTTRQTLRDLASKRLSPFSALTGGKIKCELRGHDRDGAAKWMPVLVRVGGLLRTDSVAPLLPGGLKARVLRRARRGGFDVYVIQVSATGVAPWVVERRYSEIRTAWLKVKHDLVATGAHDDDFFADAPAESAGERTFEEAVLDIKSCARPLRTEEQLEVYGLYKQATAGDVSGARPSRFDAVKRAKWAAHAARKGLSGADARAQYVAVVARLAGPKEPSSTKTPPPRTSAKDLGERPSLAFGGCAGELDDRALSFPSRREDRHRETDLDAWLSVAARQCGTSRGTKARRVADVLYPLLGATAGRLDPAVLHHAAGRELARATSFLKDGFAARQRQCEALRDMVKRGRPAPATLSAGDFVIVVLYAALLRCSRGRCSPFLAFGVGVAARPALAGVAFLSSLADAALIVPSAYECGGFLSGLVVRLLVPLVSRTLFLYATSFFAIFCYVLARFAHDKVLRIDPESKASDDFYVGVHGVMAPFVVSRIARLGSVFVKLGQYLSARADVAPAEWKSVFEALQDDLAADAPRTVRAIVRRAFGRDVDDLFATFDLEPIASASIAQVHAATLKDGTKVAVKLRHDGIDTVFRRDMADAIRIFRVCAWLNDIFDSQVQVLIAWQREIHRELDLTYEVAAMRRMHRELVVDRGSNVIITKPHDVLTAPEAFVMDWCELHCKIDDRDALAVHGVDAAALLTHFAHQMMCQVLEIGWFNSDPHPGNVALKFDDDHGSAKLVLLDWGWTHRLTKAELDAWRKLVLAFYESDTEAAIDALRALGYRTNQDDRDPARSVHFMQFLLRNPTDAKNAKEEGKQKMKDIKDRMDKDKAAGVHEKGGRYITQLPESFLFVIRVVGMVRGAAAHLGVELPLVDIMATHARRGIARDAAAAAAASA